MAFTFTREDASKMLGVSTRTIDRYVQNGKIRTKRDGKVVMLHQDDVTRLRDGGTQSDYVEIIEKAPKPMTVPTISYDSREVQNEILHMLEAIVREKDALIQELTFKLGRLDAEMNNTVPKLEHKKAVLALEETNAQRMHDMDMIMQTKRNIEQKYHRERLLVTILMIVTFIILCACMIFAFLYYFPPVVSGNTL